MRDVKQRRTWHNLVRPRDKCAQMARVLDVSSPEPSERRCALCCRPSSTDSRPLEGAHGSDDIIPGVLKCCYTAYRASNECDIFPSDACIQAVFFEKCVFKI